MEFSAKLKGFVAKLKIRAKKFTPVVSRTLKKQACSIVSVSDCFLILFPSLVLKFWEHPESTYKITCSTDLLSQEYRKSI